MDFSQIIPRTSGKLPEQEFLVAKLKERVSGQNRAIETRVQVVSRQLAAQNPKPKVVLLPGSDASAKSDTSTALAEVLETKLVRFNLVDYATSYT